MNFFIFPFKGELNKRYHFFIRFEKLLDSAQITASIYIYRRNHSFLKFVGFSVYRDWTSVSRIIELITSNRRSQPGSWLSPLQIKKPDLHRVFYLVAAGLRIPPVRRIAPHFESQHSSQTVDLLASQNKKAQLSLGLFVLRVVGLEPT